MSKIRIRRIILIAAVALALVSVIAAAVSAVSDVDSQAAEAVATKAGSRYIVAGFGGFVAVFVSGEQTPVFITDTRVDSLPRADRELLAAGIEVDSELELASILEDYGP